MYTHIMDWVLILLFCLALYILISGYIKTHNLFPSHIQFYGPILGLKTDNVAFFDWFRRYSRGLRIYGTIGVVMVIIVSILMVTLIILSVNLTVAIKPEPTAINKPQNLFLIPGLNEFVPSTVAVWFAFFFTLLVHEFGHAILCRVEKIKVKSMGILLLVIPIGAFVEPDEEEVNKSGSWQRMRMYGAGIMNNLVIGVLCFALMVTMIGWAVPSEEPIVVGLYKDYPAAAADIPFPSIIRSINDTPVRTSTEVSALLNTTQPGDHVILGLESEGGNLSRHTLNLSAWPEDLGLRPSGFMGVFYYNGPAVIQTVQKMFSPSGFLILLSLPFIPGIEGQQLRILGFEIADIGYYTAPFPYYWQVIHLLFWSGFINLAAGLFNALPMLPLDGGLIFREGTERLLARRGLERFSSRIVGAITSLMLVMMVALLTLPYLFHL